MRDGDGHDLDGREVSGGIRRLQGDGINPSITGASAFGAKLQLVIPGDLPIWTRMARAFGVHRLVAGHTDDLPRGRTAGICDVRGDDDVDEFVVGRPKDVG